MRRYKVIILFLFVCSSIPERAYAEAIVANVESQTIVEADANTPSDNNSLARRVKKTNKLLTKHLRDKISSIDDALLDVDSLLNRLGKIEADFPHLIEHVEKINQTFANALEKTVPIPTNDIHRYIILIKADVSKLDRQRLVMKSMHKVSQSRSDSIQRLIELEDSGVNIKNVLDGAMQDLSQDTQKIALQTPPAQLIQALKDHAMQVEDSVGNRVLNIRNQLNDIESVIQQTRPPADLDHFQKLRKHIKKYIFQIEMNIFDTAPDF